MRKQNPNPKTKAPATHAELAAALGISRQRVTYYAKRKDAPPISDVAGWLLYIEDTSRDGSIPAPVKRGIAKARLRILTAQAEREEIETGVRKGEVIPFATVKKFLEYISKVLFWGELERMKYEFPPGLKGKTEVEIEVEVKRQIDCAKKAIGQALDSWEERKGNV